MRNILRTAFLWSFIVVFSWSCREYEFPGQEYPGLNTLPVTDISASGALFQATVSRPGKKTVTDHGFIWSLHTNPQLNAAEKVSLGALGEGVSFKTRIEHSLHPDTTYYVKAFIETETHTVFGKVVSFKSAGSLPPVIRDVNPSSGIWGDTVVISGGNFSSLRSNLQVRLGSVQSQILANNGSTIRCVVPRDLAAASVPVSVSSAGREVKWEKDFLLESPVIRGFSPAKATFGDTLTLTGSGFNTLKSENKVRFNEYAAEVVESSRRHMRVIVPPSLNKRESTLSVVAHLQTAVSSGKFLLLPPVITAVTPLAGIRGTVVTILGSNFSPHLGGNVVMFGQNQASILSASKNKITVKVPDGTYLSPLVKVTVTVAGQATEWSQSFTIK